MVKSFFSVSRVWTNPGCTTEAAASATLRGLARGQFEIHYPRRFTLWLKLLRLLPYRLYFRLMQAFPVVGPVIGWLRRKIAHSSSS
ncbi:MAG: hypothetical protein ACKODQ_00685 [Betaproteobacteria bacterium]